MLKNATLRFLRDGSYRLPSQTLPLGYSENFLPLIRKFCSAPIERITERKGDGEFQGQVAADMPLDNSDTNSEAHHADGSISAMGRITERKVDAELQGQDAADIPLENSDTNSEAHHADGSISAMGKGLEKQGPKELHETKANVSPPQASQESHNHGKKFPDNASRPPLLQVILNTPASDLRSVLDKWIGDGNCLSTNDCLLVYSHLRTLRRHRKAFQFVEWIGTGELLNFKEHDYASHLHLLFRYNGIEAAQKYIERVPKFFRNQVLYETLLACCVRLSDVQKAEEVFQEIKNLSLPLTVSACNQMLSLYKRVARKKGDDIILVLMTKKNVKPSALTYKILIDMKCRSNDTSGMDAVLDMMKASGVEPDAATQTMIAKFYISAGLTEKTEEAVRAMEVNVNDRRHAIRSLLDLYAILGRPDDVARIWKLCTEPNSRDNLAAIRAWGKLGHIEQAEETFETMLKTSLKPPSKFFNAMLNVYAENKLLSKGEELLERMNSAGYPSDPVTWDAIVSLYVNSGEVKKADSFLLKVAGKTPGRNPLSYSHIEKPLLCSHIKLLKAYAQKGDICNAEKIFKRMKKMRYPGTSPPYDLLLEAYVNAEFPAYGFWERMRADNMRPSQAMIKQLNRLESSFQRNEAEKKNADRVNFSACS